MHEIVLFYSAPWLKKSLKIEIRPNRFLVNRSMNTFKAMFRALLVMLFLWLLSLLVLYWPLPQEVVSFSTKQEVQKPEQRSTTEANQRVRVLPVD